MIGQTFLFLIITVMAMLTVLVISFAIPVSGFIIKRWKGLLLGCLLQPVICSVVIAATIIGINYYTINKFNKLRQAAMVTVREPATQKKAHIWHVKDDDECLYEFGDSNENITIMNDENTALHDVVPLDSFRVCIDDRVIIRFDLENRQVTATNYDTPLEVVKVDWDKVNAYFNACHAPRPSH